MNKQEYNEQLEQMKDELEELIATWRIEDNENMITQALKETLEDITLCKVKLIEYVFNPKTQLYELGDKQ